MPCIYPTYQSIIKLVRFEKSSIIPCFISSFTAPRVVNIQSAIEHIYPLLTDFNIGPRRILPSSKSHDNPHRFAHKRKAIEHINPVVYADNDYDSDDLDGTPMRRDNFCGFLAALA